MSERLSVWLADRGHRSFPPLAGNQASDVVVVGGGITGLTTALLLRRRGAEVTIVEARRIAAGTTGHTTGKVTSQHGVLYSSMIQHRGEELARMYARANQQAIEDVDSLVEELGADCGFERAPAVIYATRAEDSSTLEEEHQAAQQLGLPSSLGTSTDLPFPTELALTFANQAFLDPVRYCDALAAAFVEAGGTIFEHSRVTDVREDRDAVTVVSEAGQVRAQQAVIATLLPFVDKGGFFAKTRPSRAYGIAARLSSPPPAGMYISAGFPTRSVRPWREGGGVVVVGENHETGSDQASPARWGELERWANDNFSVETFDYRWSAQDFSTIDSVPYVGRSPLMTRTSVATGFGKWGLSNGTAAASILADLILETPNPYAGAFDAGRIGDATAVANLLKGNVDVGKHLIGDRIGRLFAPSLEELQPGEGRIVESDRKTVAAYRDPDGKLHAVSTTCTHLGCTVRWNAAEVSWDCPCHGSRYAPDGTVLAGPATTPLEPVEIA